MDCAHGDGDDGDGERAKLCDACEFVCLLDRKSKREKERERRRKDERKRQSK